MDDVMETGGVRMHPIAQALRDLDEPTVNRLIDEELERGTSPLELVTHLNDGMVAVGRLFAEDEYFISQLIFSAEILKGIMLRLEQQRLEPKHDPLQDLSGEDELTDEVLVLGEEAADRDHAVVQMGHQLQGGCSPLELLVDQPVDRWFVEIAQRLRYWMHSYAPRFHHIVHCQSHAYAMASRSSQGLWIRRSSPGTAPPNSCFFAVQGCLLYTSDAADDLLCVDLGGCRIIIIINYY